MARKLHSVAVLVSLMALVLGAAAQEKNELTGIIGRTFIADQGVTGAASACVDRCGIFSPACPS